MQVRFDADLVVNRGVPCRLETIWRREMQSDPRGV